MWWQFEHKSCCRWLQWVFASGNRCKCWRFGICYRCCCSHSIQTSTGSATTIIFLSIAGHGPYNCPFIKHELFLPIITTNHRHSSSWLTVRNQLFVLANITNHHYQLSVLAIITDHHHYHYQYSPPLLTIHWGPGRWPPLAVHGGCRAGTIARTSGASWANHRPPMVHTEIWPWVNINHGF